MVNKKNRLTLVRKSLIALMAIFVLTFGVAQFLGIEVYDTAEASLKSAVKSKSIKDLENTVDKAGKTLVDTAREIAIVAAVIVMITMAYSLFWKKSAEGLADMKLRFGGLLVAIAMIFFTETILSFLFGLFGYKFT